MQWPVEELNSLRGKEVNMNSQKLQMGDYVEVKGITAAQVRFLIKHYYVCVCVFCAREG